MRKVKNQYYWITETIGGDMQSNRVVGVILKGWNASIPWGELERKEPGARFVVWNSFNGNRIAHMFGDIPGDVIYTDIAQAFRLAVHYPGDFPRPMRWLGEVASI